MIEDHPDAQKKQKVAAASYLANVLFLVSGIVLLIVHVVETDQGVVLSIETGVTYYAYVAIAIDIVILIASLFVYYAGKKTNTTVMILLLMLMQSMVVLTAWATLTQTCSVMKMAA